MSTRLIIESKNVALNRSVIATVSVASRHKEGRQVAAGSHVNKHKDCKVHNLEKTLQFPRVVCYSPNKPLVLTSPPVEEQCILYYRGNDTDQPDQKKALALSRMYSNVLQEMPKLLDNHDYTIYTDDMEFVSHLPILPTVYGRASYKLCLTAWCNSLRLLYTDLYIDVMESTKDEDTVTVRWGICGNNRIPMNMSHSYTRVFDATSTFFPDDKGLIKTHILDKRAMDKYPNLLYTLPMG